MSTSPLARIFSPIRRFFTRSIRRQLILGIALVHAVLMTIFVFDLVARQREFLHRQAVAQARGMAETLAASSASWVLADDVIGLEEVIRSQAGYPGLRYAMVLSPRGKVLGHTEPKNTGLFVADDTSLSLLKAEGTTRTLVADDAAIDVAAPIFAKRKLIGWARIGLGQDQIAASLFAVARDGLLYALLAIAAGTAFAYLMARGLTGGLDKLVRVAEGIRSGKRGLRINPERQDEVGRLAADFNLMLDTLEEERRRQAMEHSVVRLLAHSPTAEGPMPAIIRAVCETMGWNCGLYWQWDAKEGLLHCAAHWGADPERISDFVAASFQAALAPTLDAGLVRRAFASGEPYWIADVTGDPDFMRASLAARCGLHGAFAFPVLTQGMAVGALEFFSNEIRPPDAALLQIARAIGSQVGQFIARKQAEAAREESEARIRRLNDELERKVAERTAELEAANKELESFAYSTSHDLRAPLRSIDGFSSLLMTEYGDRLDAQGLDYLRRVRAASQRMAQLIDDLLELSQVTRSAMKRQEVDLSALAHSIADELRETQPERKADFAIAPGLVASGDATLLRVALQNLLGNAWKYTGKRDLARIEMGAAEVEGKPGYFVRDNGAGFDMAYKDKLFRPFQRLHRPADFEGNGIGLATVQRIVERHGGRVLAEGHTGMGAVFFFTLA